MVLTLRTDGATGDAILVFRELAVRRYSSLSVAGPKAVSPGLWGHLLNPS